MTPERWKQVEQLYHSVLERPQERAGLLAVADTDIRKEVEALLAADHEQAGATQTMAGPLGVGVKFGSYRIEGPLGEGAMGVVYKATDTKLNRSAAIKFLSNDLADEAARRRFQMEAQTASSLNHPHIITVYDVGEYQGRQYLVTEYMDGGTLKQWARAEKRTWRQVVELLTGIADALATAHTAGILHRDIKPDNILMSKSGYAKLADFGLAKLAEGNVDILRTLTDTTRPGVIVGTIAYMSPEQASGHKLDARSDIFSLGVVLYELLEAKRPFSGSGELELLKTIIHGSPAPLTQAVPPLLKFAVEKSLEKDPNDRYHSARELAVDLRRIARSRETANVPAPVAASRGRAIPLLTATLGLALGAAGMWFFNAPEPPLANPLANAQFTRLSDVEGNELDAAISPDGKFVAFLSDRAGQFDVWLTQAGTGSPVNLTPGKEDERTPLRSVGFTNDGTELWLAGIDTRKPRLVPLVGGAPRSFLGDRVTSPVWSPDGSRLAYHMLEPGDPIYVADKTGGNPGRIYVDRADVHNHYLTWSKDANWIYFVHGMPASNEMDLWRIATTGGQPERLTEHNSEMRDPMMLDDRTIVYVARDRDGSGPWLWAYDTQRKITRRVTFGLEKYTSVSASADGRRLAVTVSNPNVGLWSVPILGRIAEERDVTMVELPSARAMMPRFGGSALYFLSSRGAGDGLWRFAEGRSTEIWKGSEGALLEPPAISPDGRRIAILLRRQGKRNLHSILADGSDVQPLAPEIDAQGSAAWSPDGNWIVTGGNDGKGDGLFKIPVNGGSVVRLTPKQGRNPVWSPDGSVIAYAGPNVFSFTPLLAVRPDGATVDLPEIRMQRDGERLRFMPDGRLIYMQGTSSSSWQDFWLLDLASKQTRQLTRLSSPATMRTFDVSADGTKIVFDRLRENSDVAVIDLQEPGK